MCTSYFDLVQTILKPKKNKDEVVLPGDHAEEPWCEVPRRVQSKATVEAEADSDREHRQPDVQGHQLLGHLLSVDDDDEDGGGLGHDVGDNDLHVPPVSDGADAEDQQAGGKELVSDSS